MKILTSFLLLGFLLINASTEASDQTLRFELSPYKNAEVHCENPDNIWPLENDFELLDYHFMSSESGERYAVVTVKNSSLGLRTFTENYLIGFLGNCEVVRPVKLERPFKGGEVHTFQLSFGRYKYPLLKLINAR